MIIFGFATTAVLFHQTKREWESDPVMTTIDSMAKPVSTVNFPTVTVCQNKHGPLDNWALVEKVVNFIKFECNYDNGLPNCTEARDIRKKFMFVNEFIVQEFGAAIDATIENNEEIDYLSPETNGIANLIANILAQNLTTKDNINRRLSEGLGSFGYYLNFLKAHVNVYESEMTDTKDCFEERSDCYDDFVEGRKLAIKIQILYSKGFLPLGTMLSSFAPLFLNSLKRKADWVTCQRKCSRLFKKEEIIFHDFMANLSSYAGIGDESARISLFNVPTILGSLDWGELFGSNPRNSFYYDHCSHNESRCTTKSCPKIMEDHIFGKGEHPCSILGKHNLCCNFWGRKLQGNLTKIMGLMKHTLHRGLSHERLEDIVELFVNQDSMQLFNEVGKGHSRLEDLNYEDFGAAFDSFSMVPLCQYINGGFVKTKYGTKNELRDCKLLAPVPTNKGLCYAFNTLPIEDLINPSQFASSFRGAFRDEIDQNRKVRGRELEKGSTGEEETGLTLFLDRQTLGRNEWRYSATKEKGFVSIGINSMLNVFSMRSKQVKIRFGLETEVKVQPIVQKSDEELRSLKIKHRNCRFPDETDGRVSIFKTYTQSTCQFECMLQFSRKSCHCTPWDYPFHPQEQVKLCDSLGYYCFDNFMKNKTHMESCLCEPDCHSLDYIVSVKELPIYPESYCATENFIQNYINEKITRFGYGFVLNFNWFKFGEALGNKKTNYFSYFNDELCKKFIQNDLAIVRVQMASETFTQTRQSLRMGTIDQIANLGKTVSIAQSHFLKVLYSQQVAHWAFSLA